MTKIIEYASTAIIILKNVYICDQHIKIDNSVKNWHYYVHIQNVCN